jgi:N-acetylglucosamine repressor
MDLHTRPLRSAEIRQANEKLILHLMHRKNPISQSELVAHTGLQASTVFRIFKSLEDRDFIKVCKEKENTGNKKGRKPVYYTVNPNVAYAAGIDISSYGASLLLIDFSGTTVAEKSLSYESRSIEAEDFIASIIALVEDGLDEAEIPLESLLGIGIGAPGIVDIQRGSIVRYSRFPGMEDYPLKEKIEKHFSAPVFLHNNTSVIALSELRYGRAKGKNSLVAFLIRAGVGGAYVSEGRIFESQGKTAFEAGHMAVDLLQVGKSAGQETLEDFVSEEAILKRVTAETGRVTGWKDLLYYLEQRDEQVLGIMRELVRVLLGATHNIALLLNPEVILIICRYRVLAEFIAEELDHYISSRFDPACIDTHKIIPLEFDPAISCRGAAEFVFDDYFGISDVKYTEFPPKTGS